MPCHRRVKGCQSRIGIPNFADEDDVGILPQDGTQHFRKRQAGLLVDLDLTDAVDFIFDGIFYRHDVDRLLANFIDTSVERGCLSTTCWPNGEQHPLRSTDQPVQLFFDLRAKTKLSECH